MAFSDELSWSIDAIRTVRDDLGVFADALTYTLQNAGGTTTSGSGDKEGATWREEIYHGRRVDHQKVLV